MAVDLLYKDGVEHPEVSREDNWDLEWQKGGRTSSASVGEQNINICQWRLPAALVISNHEMLFPGAEYRVQCYRYS